MDRSRKLVFVAHPILNQNSMPVGKEKAPGAVKEVVEILAENGIGIIQMPCPELECFGIERKPKNKEELEEEMRKKKFQVPIIGINMNNTFSSAEKLQSLVNA